MSNPISKATEPPLIVAPDADLRVLFNLPPDVQIEFRGSPILALDQRFNNATASTQYLSHELVRERFFYTLPPALWEAICQKIGENRFDSQLVEMERKLGRMCGDHSASVGLWRGQILPFAHLHSLPPLQIDAADFDSSANPKNQAHADHIARVAQQHLEGPARVSRAYLGWLLTNRQFLEEHDALLATWEPMIRRWGFHSLGLAITPFVPENGETELADWQPFNAAFEEFFVRWRLRGLAGPYLPMPLQPLMAGGFPFSVVKQLMRSGGVFCIPDTYPIPSRDELRGLLDGALHHAESPAHLAEWMKLIASENMAKQALKRFGRLFQLQHYYLILSSRHAAVHEGKLSRVRDVFSKFFATSARTIDVDLAEIRKRLGENWMARGASSPLGPY